MAYNSSSSNANSKVHTCSSECEKSYAQLKKLYDEQRENSFVMLYDKTDVLTYHKKLLAEALKEKEDLKTKFEFGKDDRDFVWLGLLQHDGMHAVPPLMTGNYIPSGPDIEIDESQFTYGPKQTKPSESDTRSSDFDSCKSNTSVETLDCMPEPVVNEPSC
ncbi:hypothetical protein Tco_0300802 [Tanacetum coccineum]